MTRSNSPMRQAARAAAAAAICLCSLAGAADPTPLKELPYSPSLDLSSLDRSVDPCSDFYQFTCGGWQQRNPIPADQAGWSVYGKLQQDNLRFLWGLLEEAAEPTPDRSTAQRQTGDYFAACMKQDDIEAAGAKPLAPTLAAIDGIASVKGIAAALAALHRDGVDGSLFRFASGQDLADSSRVIATVDAGGLGLPDRDQYLKTDKKSKEIRAAYQAHLQRSFVLLGDGDAHAKANAASVFDIETALARASFTRVQRRDPKALYHPTLLARLTQMAPAFDWPAYLGAVGVPKGTLLNVAEPVFVRQLQTQLSTRPLAQWKTYLRWHALRAQAPYLSTPFAAASFDFYSRTLRGVKEPPPRWRQCVEWVDRDLGESLGQVFVAKTFTADTRQRAADMTRAIQRVMERRINQLDWMNAKTKQAALAKLRTMVNKIGYPDRWRDYGALEVKRADFFGNVQRALAFENRRQIAKIGQPVDRDEWQMTPPTVNAYYEPQLNEVNLPAGILQPPLFDPKLDDAPNYGNTGSTIGHELTHGFDDEGRQYDAQGNLRDWWTKKDAAEFKRRASCVVEQYSAYPAVDELKVNGELTLGEDLADLGGAIIAYLAWKDVAAGQTLPAIDGFTPEQRFFIGMAQWACSNERPESQRLRAQTDPHSPPRWRVNGVVTNMPEFAAAFSCTAGQPMARAKVCRVW